VIVGCACACCQGTSKDSSELYDISKVEFLFTEDGSLFSADLCDDIEEGFFCSRCHGEAVNAVDASN